MADFQRKPPPKRTISGELDAIDPPTELEPGQMLEDRYKIVRKLGSGATASVYLARHSRINRLVAIKVLRTNARADPKLVQRFLNEGQAVGAMGHPHIVESTDMGYMPDGAPFLVLEYLEGRDLGRELAAMGPLETGRAIRLITQVASALAAAHGKGIVHRDLKPENVFLVQRVGRADHVKVLDFGVSKFASEGVTEAGVIYGTADFLSPEQVGATDAVDGRTDVYALGVLLYQTLTGHLPFEDYKFPDILRAIVTEPPTPISRWSNDVPREAVEIVERCLKKKPEERFQTMSELETALLPLAETPVSSVTSMTGNLVATRPSVDNLAVPPAPSVRVTDSAAPVTGHLSTSSHSAPIPQPQGLGRWIGALALFAILVALAFLLRRQLMPSQDTATTAPDSVTLAVQAKKGAKMTFRGREYLLPFKGDVSSSSERERIDVTLESGQTRTVWVVLDAPNQVTIASTQ